jgi:DNA polymerase (family X)
MMDKGEIAGILDEIATLLELTGENPFKIRAYAAGARVLETLAEDLDTLIATGLGGKNYNATKNWQIAFL